MKTSKFISDNQEDCLNRSCAKVQEEEFSRILDLRKNLQFSDMLIKHLSNYLGLGWHLAVLNSQSQVQQLINFQQPQESWSEKLIELGLDGVEVNVGVRTGSTSRLLILEVRKQGRTLPFRREDWSSNCVAEAGVLFEHHYYEVPEGWLPPPSFVLEPFEVKVFGEGDLVLAPPSLEPRTQANWRWLKPPWDSPPGPPSAILRKIIQVAAPDAATCLPAPEIPSWEEIYPAIVSHPTLLQALMSPAPSSESYYQRLLEAALAGGLQEPQLLLGLLWHAPLGDAQKRPLGQQYLQQLLHRQGLAGEPNVQGPDDQRGHDTSPVGSQLQAVRENPRRLVDSRQGSQLREGDNGSRPSFRPAAPAPDWRDEEQPPQNPRPSGFTQGNWEFGGSWQELFQASQESLIVERHRYEAMIYELGKLQVWQEICRQERRINQRLHRKLEAQFAREVDFLRNLLKTNS
ncbi:MAG: hypothetical protein P8168_07410 [Deltaproteobacteria bacterium]